jgi:uncharacterized protein YndB with AHSA1/START domain
MGRVMAHELIRREVELPASPREVWEALIDGKRVSTWFGAEVEMTSGLGGRARFHWPDGRERGAVIEAFEPEQLLILRWLPFERDAGSTTREVPGTRIRFTLGRREGGTLLTVEETLPSLRGEPSTFDAVGPPSRHASFRPRAGAGR